MAIYEHRLDGECPDNTPGCICNDMRQLYKNGELGLFHGKVSRPKLQRSLGLPTGSLKPSSKFKLYKRARRCIANFDTYLYNHGHGTVWEEKIPEIEAYLKSLKNANSLPVNSKGNLCRAAILEKFGLGNGSTSIISKRAPRLKMLLDRYDTTAGDPAYTQYKYSKYTDKLALLLDSPELELTYGRWVSIKWISSQLDIPPNAITKTPQLKKLFADKQFEVDRLCRSGSTQKFFRINGVYHLNVGSKPYSEKHQRIFDFTRLVKTFGLNFSEKVATVFISLVADMAPAKSVLFTNYQFFIMAC